MTGTTNSRKFSNHKNVRGITLVELIVVISIIAIMSTAVVGSASVFLKRSTIQKNQNNAETIYQAAQAALQQMQKGGEEYKTESGKLKIKNAWVEDLMAQGTAYPFVSSNLSPEMEANKTYYSDRYDSDAFSTFNASTADTNESVHMRYVLTASKNNPNSDQSKLLRGLLLTYFNNIGSFSYKDDDGNTYEVDSASIFNGTVTAEFDVEKSADAYGEEHLTAKCLSVFFDSRATNGWPERAYEGSDKTVPSRKTSYRNDKSLIGYYDGYKGTAVDTVYLPKVQEGIVVKKFEVENETITITPVVTTPPDPPADPPTPEPTPIVEEHVRIVWAATLDKSNLVGSAKDVYYRIALMNGINVSKVLYINEDFLLGEDQINGNKHKFDYFKEFADGSVKIKDHDVRTETYTAVYSSSVQSEVTKKSIDVTAKVFVTNNDLEDYRALNKDQINAKVIEMPLRISYVTGELDYKSDTDHPAKAAYLEYSLDLTGGDASTVLTEQTDSAIIKIYPNYFTNGVMAGTNDETGIIAFKKGRSVDINQEEAAQTTP